MAGQPRAPPASPRRTRCCRARSRRRPSGRWPSRPPPAPPPRSAAPRRGRRFPRAVEQRRQRRRVLGRLCRPGCRATGCTGRPASSGCTSRDRILPSFSTATDVGPEIEISSVPSAPCTSHARLRPQRLQRLGHGKDQVDGKGAGELSLDARRVGQRAEDVEDRLAAQFGADRHDGLHRRVVHRRHHEADPGLGDGTLHHLGGRPSRRSPAPTAHRPRRISN